MLLIALTHVRIKQRARVIIYYSIQSILEILSRTPVTRTLAHDSQTHTSVTLSSLKVSCQPYFTNTLLIYLITLLSLSFLHELLYNFQFLTIKSYQQFINKVINMSTISYICLYLFIYLFILLFIYIIYYYYIILYYTSNLKKLLKDFFDFRYIICIS